VTELFSQPAVLYCIPACHRARNTSGNLPEMSPVLQNVSSSVCSSALTLWTTGNEGLQGCRKLTSVISLASV